MTALLDQALAFTIPDRHARGRLVRLGPVLREVLSAHGYPPALERLLAEALLLTALLGSTLKETAGQLTLQAQASGGAVDLLVCDYRGGAMRGYLRHDAERVADLDETADLPTLFGAGYLAITFDQATSGDRYQGIVPLEGASLAEAAQSYFAQSEQIPSLVRIDYDPATRIAGGMMLQHLPEGEEGRERLHTRLDHPEWEHVATLGRSLRPDELTDPGLPLERLLWRLFNEDEVRVQAPQSLEQKCRCDPEHFRAVIARFPADERREMADENGIVHVDCEFCASSYALAFEPADRR